MKETKIEYMTRRLEEFRIMKPEKTLPLQRDFPNCEKYKPCCTKDKDFWNDLQKRIKELEWKPTFLRTKDIEIKSTKEPEEFKGY